MAFGFCPLPPIPGRLALPLSLHLRLEPLTQTLTRAGNDINDCLAADGAGGGEAKDDAPSAAAENGDGEAGKPGFQGVQIGEALDGRVITRNLSVHRVPNAEELTALVALAKSRRSTAATERNDESSRSHGIGIIRVGQPGYPPVEEGGPQEGTLYLIDLAGSERAAGE